MSNGFLLAAEADLAVVQDIGEGFGLDVIGAGALGDHDAAVAALASAANVGIVLSVSAAADAAYVALLQTLGARLQRAQLLVADADARAAFQFLPAMWPVMSLNEARMRANALAQQREPAPAEPPPAAEPAPAPEPKKATPEAPPTEAETDSAQEESNEHAADQQTDVLSDSAAIGSEDASVIDDAERAESFKDGACDEVARAITEDEPPVEEQSPAPSAEPPWADGPISRAGHSDDTPPEQPQAPPADPPWADGPISRGTAPSDDAAPPSSPPADEPVSAAPPPMVDAPPPAPAPQARAPEAPTREQRDEAFGGAVDMHSSTAQRQPDERLGETAPADATAFAPKKLRRATPELVRIVIHQPKDLSAVIKAARRIDKRAEPAPQGMSIGEVALGASVGVALEVRGASCDGAVQRRTWSGEPIDFSFSIEAEQGVKQAVILARVFVDDAQIGVLAFTRNITGPGKKPASDGDRVRLKRHKRVFLSYSSKDREVVSAIATAYARAGVEHFWDRASLKSGEEWSPRLRKEIERADLFHLCWSKSAATSEWVQKEAEHALTRRKRNSGRPEITVQMLDGPPWAPHPASLDSINFDDFVRAAIVGYARGEA